MPRFAEAVAAMQTKARRDPSPLRVSSSRNPWVLESGSDVKNDGRREKGGGKRPEARETDRLQVRTTEAKRNATEAERRLLDAVARVHFTDEGGASVYQESLSELRARSPEVRKAVTDLELATPNDHNFHWTLYYVLADLESLDLSPMLVDAAARDLPDITEATGCETVEADEVLVAAMAVEGLERLARKEPGAGIGALLEVVERQAHVAIRTAAVQAILSVRPGAEPEIARLLPDDQLFVLEARRISVEQLSAIPERATPKRSGIRSPKLSSDADMPHPKEGSE